MGKAKNCCPGCGEKLVPEHKKVTLVGKGGKTFEACHTCAFKRKNRLKD